MYIFIFSRMKRNTFDFFGYIIFLFLCIVLIRGFTSDELPDGPYCSRNNNCCKGRNNTCVRYSLNHTCYCDEDCSRLDGLINDCCPDYSAVCEPQKKARQCELQGNKYDLRTSVKDYCNDCTCELLNNVPRMKCTKNLCLLDGNQIDAINNNWRNNKSMWAAESYPDFQDEPLENGKFWLGTAKPGNLSQYLDQLVLPTYGSLLPTNFIIKTSGNTISISNQGSCQSSFEQSLLDVLKDRDYISKRHSSANNVHFPEISRYCRAEKAERNLGEAWKSLWQSGSICRPFHLTTPENIKHEILNNGPVQATMKVFQDFFVYKEGIYQHEIVPGEQPLGYHSVRVIGWGEEVINGRNYKYWVAANSWSEQWGKQGLFRILIDRNECEFEWHVIAN